jgi:hypothetical protein
MATRTWVTRTRTTTVITQANTKKLGNRCNNRLSQSDAEGGEADKPSSTRHTSDHHGLRAVLTQAIAQKRDSVNNWKQFHVNCGAEAATAQTKSTTSQDKPAGSTPLNLQQSCTKHLPTHHDVYTSKYYGARNSIVASPSGNTNGERVEQKP